MNRTYLLAVLSSFVLAETAHGHPVDVANPSFEAPVLTPGAYTTYSNDGAQNIPGWKTAGGWVGAQNKIGNYESAVPDGMNFAYEHGGEISQVIGMLQPGTYKL